MTQPAAQPLDEPAPPGSAGDPSTTSSSASTLPPSRRDAGHRDVAPFVAAPVIGIAVVAGLTVLASARYGYHRDELYFIAGGERLQAGFVDHPPLTTLIARAADVLLGHSVLGLRAVAGLVVAGGVVATAALARELGGRRSAQLLAAFAAAASPILRGNNLFFGTTGLDQLIWAVAMVLVARLLRTANTKLWLPLGVVIGIGLETKATILLLVLSLLVGLIVVRRAALMASPWFAAGLLAAALLWAPNLVWNAQHSWAMVEWNREKNDDFGDLALYVYFVVATFIMAGVTTVFVWLPGARWLLARTGTGRSFRALGIAAAVAIAVLFVTNAKYYYVAPVFLLLFAAGAVALEAAGPAALRTGAWMVALSIVLCAPLTLPLLPPSALMSLSTFARDYPDMIGWNELTTQVRDVVASLPPEQRQQAVVVTSNYGEAAALEHFAPELRVFSGHNTYYLWGPPPASASSTVLVGFGPGTANRVCRSPQQVGTIRNDAGLENVEAGRGIWVCPQLTRPWPELWPTMKDYN